MRRKNWINKKKIFYDNFLKINKNNKNLFFNIFLKKKEYLYDPYNTRGQLYKVMLNKNKNSFLEYEFNYYFYTDLFRSIKFLNKNLIFKNFIKNKNDILLFSPAYTFKNQFFSNRSVFNDILTNFKLKGFFLYKNFFKNIGYKNNNYVFKNHIIGYNFYIFNKTVKSNNDLTKLLSFIDDKDFNGIGKVKLFLKQEAHFNAANEIQFFFNFNLYCINVLEIYKITIFLYLSKI